MKPRTRFSLAYYLWIFFLLVVVQSTFFSRPDVPQIAYSEFLDRVAKDQVEKVVLTQGTIYGEMKSSAPDAEAGEGSRAAPSEPSAPTPAKAAPPAAAGGAVARPASAASHPSTLEPPAKETPWRLDLARLRAWWSGVRADARREAEERQDRIRRQFTVTPVEDRSLVATLQAHGVDFRAELETHFFRDLFLNWVIPFGLMFLVWGYVMRRMGQGPAALNLGKSKARIYEVDPNDRVHFSDVAGVDEAIEETREVVAFLKEPSKYTRLGAKLPTGVLLVGPPGTGKTLLARAVAGEAGVPFFSLSGSDFVEMFVGVGAARVRDLFGDAKKKAPCIIFIDELDAIGKSRAGQGPVVGGYDERENTLNQLLVEMDGFDKTAGVVLIAATNRPEVLDPALLRPGRFDRQILVDRPDREGRLAIFRVHVRHLKLAADVDLATMAAQTVGFVGADIANLCNEAALLAARRSRDEIRQVDFQDAMERVIGGLEKKNRVLNVQERRTVAYHESGHTLIGYFTPGADPVQKVSIVPRGRGALGYTLQAPLEDRYLMSYDELLGRIRTLMGGRAAEELTFGVISTGASDDIEKASRIARDMITVYGMSKRLPNLSLVGRGQVGFLGQGPDSAPHSAEIERLVGEEQLEILRSCYGDAKRMLEERRAQLEALAQRLLAQEKLDAKDLAEILGERAAAGPKGVLPSGGAGAI
ncbi:MAG TPA: ATP-dependent zinc metalloprotease FtsH [Candidatus Binatia bacterium]|nr:ATP-dependent zinc metalloprotease FtsH [Candidatus Binatia bacterium]